MCIEEARGCHMLASVALGIRRAGLPSPSKHDRQRCSVSLG